MKSATLLFSFISLIFAAVTLLSTTAAATAAETPSPSRSTIESAFHGDNFTVQRWISYGNGQGCVALANNATTLNTGNPKRAYYVAGSGYEMGYIMASLVPHDVETMAITYFDRLIPELAVPGLAKKLQNDSAWQEFEKILGGILVDIVYHSFQQQPVGTYPKELIDEIRGAADAMKSLNASTPVSFERLITVNVGFDLLSALGYSGNFSNLLISTLKKSNHTRLANILEDYKTSTKASMFKEPAACNAFGAGGSATVCCGV